MKGGEIPDIEREGLEAAPSLFVEEGQVGAARFELAAFTVSG